MFKYLFLLFLAFYSLHAQETHSSYQLSVEALQSIEHDGIVYGSGSKNVYVFLDPLCPYSRKFLSLVASNDLMLKKYRYTIYLYEIPRLQSAKTIASIYASHTPLQTLLDVMLHDAKIPEKSGEAVAKTISEIEEVGKKLHVKKRPFLVVQK